jgi:hypothetical protein
MVQKADQILRNAPQAIKNMLASKEPTQSPAYGDFLLYAGFNRYQSTLRSDPKNREPHLRSVTLPIFFDASQKLYDNRDILPQLSKKEVRDYLRTDGKKIITVGPMSIIANKKSQIPNDTIVLQEITAEMFGIDTVDLEAAESQQTERLKPGTATLTIYSPVPTLTAYVVGSYKLVYYNKVNHGELPQQRKPQELLALLMSEEEMNYRFARYVPGTLFKEDSIFDVILDLEKVKKT